MSQKYKPGAFRRKQQDEEGPIRRVDRADGVEYTKDDFFECYERHNEWHAAGISEQAAAALGQEGIEEFTLYMEGENNAIEFGLALLSAEMMDIIPDLNLSSDRLRDLQAFIVGDSIREFAEDSGCNELSETSYNQLLSLTIRFCSTGVITSSEYLDAIGQIDDSLPSVAVTHLKERGDNGLLPILDQLSEEYTSRKVAMSKAVMERLTERVGPEELLEFRKVAVREFMSVSAEDSESLLKGAVQFYTNFCKVFSKDKESLSDLCRLLDCPSRTVALERAKLLADISPCEESQLNFYYDHVVPFSEENAEECLCSYFDIKSGEPSVDPLAQLLWNQLPVLTKAVSNFVMNRLADIAGAEKLKQFRNTAVKTFMSEPSDDVSGLLNAAVTFFSEFTNTFSTDFVSLNGLCFILNCPAKAAALSNSVRLSQISTDKDIQLSFYTRWVLPFSSNRLSDTVEEYINITDSSLGVQPLVSLLPPRFELKIRTLYEKLSASQLSEEEADKRKYELMQQLKRESEANRAARNAEQKLDKEREKREAKLREEEERRLKKKAEEEARAQKAEEKKRQQEAEAAARQQAEEDRLRKERLIAEEKEKRAKREAKVREQEEAKRKLAEERRLKQKAEEEAARIEKEKENKRRQEAEAEAKREKEEAKRLRQEAEAEARRLKEEKKQQRREEEAANRRKKEQQKLERQKAEQARKEAAAAAAAQKEQRESAERERKQEEVEARKAEQLAQEESGKAAEAARLRAEAEPGLQKQQQQQQQREKAKLNAYQAPAPKNNKKQQQQQQQQERQRKQAHINWRFPKSFWERNPHCVGCNTRLTPQPCPTCC